jgi:hypothetical protein
MLVYGVMGVGGVGGWVGVGGGVLLCGSCYELNLYLYAAD